MYGMEEVVSACHGGTLVRLEGTSPQQSSSAPPPNPLCQYVCPMAAMIMKSPQTE